MKIVVHYSLDAEHQKEWGEAFVKGLQAHGEPSVTVTDRLSPRNMDADLAVFWGHKKTAVIDCQIERGKDYLVMERGYFNNRYTFLSLGFNGLNGRAEFHNQDMPSDRWDKHGTHLAKPWRQRDGNHILLIGQVEGDASHRHLVDIKTWYEKTKLKLEMLQNKPVVFRPHPLSLPPSRRIKGSTILEALEHAHCVVLFNSNSAVDSVIAGVPVVAFDEGCMAWEVCGQKLEDVLNPPKPDRQQWFNNLAYCQWTLDEVESGEAWEHLKKRYK